MALIIVIGATGAAVAWSAYYLMREPGVTPRSVDRAEPRVRRRMWPAG